MSIDPQVFQDVARAVRDSGLLGEGEQFVVGPLSGGVSCDVFLVEVKRKPPVVVKRALPKLRVEADWRAPVERAESEVDWIRLVATLDPRLVPRVIWQDRARHLFVMEYLPPERFPVWKAELAAGVVDVPFAAEVGHRLAQIHAATAGSEEIAQRFANRDQFMALRLDAYLLHAARANPDVGAILRAIVDSVAIANIALMQGDVSPKNILHGPETPVFLDAETTCYGDPAFDLAFCLNHLLLKCIWHPEHADAYLAAFGALSRTYLDGVNWEPREEIARRASRLLAGLLLARVDGKSPVEYITRASDKAFVRDHAKTFLLGRELSLKEMGDAWRKAVRGYFTVSGTR
jgi:aminoglycoside phosphotransferase (APT) family kinase protein